MIVHALFPIIVCQFNYPNHKEFKELFFNNSMKHLNSSGYSDEMTGHVTIHHEETYADMYKFLVSSVRNYLDVLNVQHSSFEVNVIKSWLNILENRNTPMHAHKDAHISTSYYANTPKETNQPIRFHNYDQRIEPYAGCLLHNNNGKWDMANSYSWEFLPKEGDLFVFPSSLMHDTIVSNSGKETGVRNKEHFLRKRVCIASDVLLTYKEKKASPLGIQPVVNWRNFSP